MDDKNLNKPIEAENDELEDYEIEALFDAVDKIARGEEPDILPEKRSREAVAEEIATKPEVTENPETAPLIGEIEEIDLSDIKALDNLLGNKMEEPIANTEMESKAPAVEMKTETEERPEGPEEKTEVEPGASEDDIDLFALLNGMGEEDEDLKEIEDLLQKSDNNEMIQTDSELEEQVTEDVENSKRKNKKEKKSWFKKKKKEEKIEEQTSEDVPQNSPDTQLPDGIEALNLDNVEVLNPDGIEELNLDGINQEDFHLEEKIPEKKEKKQSFLSKLFALLFEEDEPEVSDENEQILKELDEEDKKKGKKTKKSKKGKKNAVTVLDEDGNEAAIPDKKKDKQKKTKKEKVKKVRPVTPENEKPGKKVSKESIILVALFAAAIFAILFILVQVISPKMAKEAAIAAYNRQDYQTYYDALYGQNRSEKEELMFRHAEMILRSERKLVAYDKFMKKNMRLEALDSLMQVVAYYNEKYEDAVICGAVTEMTDLYHEALTFASEEFGLDETKSRNIALNENDVEYTRILTDIVSGENVEIPSDSETIPDSEDPEMIPGEEGMESMEYLP
ncbi:MAG: hypothetical protein ACI4EX_08230 [Lachnospiraceae bacterium]